MKTRALLIRAREEIKSLRWTNERQVIRLEAIEDMLSLFRGGPKEDRPMVLSSDLVYQIDLALLDSNPPEKQKKEK